jgi:hypothetical protein
MPNYRDFCEAFFAYEWPHAQTVDQTLRALPWGMREAIVRNLGVPALFAQFATEIFGVQTKYVDLYYPTIQPDGRKTYVSVDNDSGIYFVEERYHFCIGVCAQHLESPSDAGKVFIEFCVEECGELWATLSIENMHGSINVGDTRDTNSFDDAAAEALDRVVTAMKGRGREIETTWKSWFPCSMARDGRPLSRWT